MPPLSEKELEERLAASGKSLVQLPSSLDELLPLLDQIWGLLAKVEQSPTKSMQTALSLLMKALVTEDLLKHCDVDVKVGVASCISEITRITAPDAPYDDDKMKDVFQLIVSSFENLSDMSNRSYEKRATILETVAKVRSCVIMLDLECDQMIVEMFQHFLKAIRAYHPEIIFTSMETVMTLVLEESEDISVDLLTPILTLLKRNNEAAMPIAKKLAEQVIQNSADKLRPYLRQAVKSLDTSLDDYSEVVASACQENTDTAGHSNKIIFDDHPVVEGNYTDPPAQNSVTQAGSEETNIQDKDPTATRSLKSVVSNGINETGPKEIMADTDVLKTAGPNFQLDAKSMFITESDDFGAKKPVISEAKEELAESQKVLCDHGIPDKYVHTSPTEVKPAELAKSSDIEGCTIQHSLSDAPESEAMTVASPILSGSHSDESQSETDTLEKGKANLVSEEMVSVETSSEKASEGESISEAKKQQPLGKKRTAGSAGKDETFTDEGASRNNDGCASDSKARSLEQAEKVKENMVLKDMASVDTASKKASEGESILEANKQQRSRKKRTADSSDKGKTSTLEVTLKNDDGCARDSEAQSLDQAEKGNLVMEEMVSVDTASKRASEEEPISEAQKQWCVGKKRTADSAGKGKTLTVEVTTKKDDGCASDSEARSLDQAEKGKGNLVMKEMVSVDTASKKASEGEPISEAKKQRRSGKRRTADLADKGTALTVEITSKNDDGCASDSEVLSQDKAEKGKGNLVIKELGSVDTASKKASEGEPISEAKKRRRLGKKRTAESADKGETLTVEVTTKNDECCPSDSEAQSLDQAEKSKATLVSEERVSVDTASKKASEGESISEAKKQRRSRKKRIADSAVKGKTLIVDAASKNDDGCASDSEARSLDQAKKIEDASNKTDYWFSLKGEDSKKSGRAKHASENDVPRSAREDHGKDTITSWKSPLKSTKNEGIQEETPRTSNKRKQTPGKEKASETPEYGKNLIGSKVQVWWPKDRMFYEGEIVSFDPVKKKHKVLYADGDEEVLNLKKERWELVGDVLVSDGDQDVEHSSQDTSSDMRRKKGNLNLETSSKRQKVEGSPKSELKDTLPKSGGKSKDDGKAEPGSKDNYTKPSKKSVGDTIKSKDQTQKLGGKGQVDLTKASGRSKEDVAKVSSRLKQDSERTSKSKDKTPQSGKTLGSSGAKMTKSNLSKVKETDPTKEKTAESAKSSETAKGKSTDTAKSRESETKGGKKRRR